MFLLFLCFFFPLNASNLSDLKYQVSVNLADILEEHTFRDILITNRDLTPLECLKELLAKLLVNFDHFHYDSTDQSGVILLDSFRSRINVSQRFLFPYHRPPDHQANQILDFYSCQKDLFLFPLEVFRDFPEYFFYVCFLPGLMDADFDVSDSQVHTFEKLLPCIIKSSLFRMVMLRNWQNWHFDFFSDEISCLNSKAFVPSMIYYQTMLLNIDPLEFFMESLSIRAQAGGVVFLPSAFSVETIKELFLDKTFFLKLMNKYIHVCEKN